MTYSYDAFDRVAARGADGFAYDGMSNDLVSDGSGQFSRLPDGSLLGLRQAGQNHLAWTDEHGDLVALLGADGKTIAGSRAYDPFGKPTAQQGQNSALGYQGAWTDPTTGEVNMHARWYTPGTGNFASRDGWLLSPDPSIQANRYTYVSGQPMNLADPSGHKECKPGKSAVATTAYLICMAIKKDKDKGKDKDKSGNSGKNGDDDSSGGVFGKRDPDETQARWDKARMDCAAAYTNAMGLRDECKKLNLPVPRLPGNRGQGNFGNGNGMGSIDRPGTSGTGGTSPGSPGGPGMPGKPGKPTVKPKPVPPANVYTGKNPPRATPKPPSKPNPARPADNSWDPSKGTTGTAQDPKTVADKYGQDMSTKDVPTTKSPQSNGSPNRRPDQREPNSCGVSEEPNSFTGDTPVVMADGTRKPIRDVKVGDKVLATDPETGKTETREVTALIVGEGQKDLVEITIDLDGTSGDSTGKVTATAGHPFWVPQLGEWLDAGELQPGQWLRTSSGTWIQITAVKAWTGAAKVYNLTVAGIHTYYIDLAGSDALVHNTGGADDPECDDDPTSAYERVGLGESDLAEMAVEYRLEDENIGAGQNIAVFEYSTPDGVFHYVSANIPKGDDAEVVIHEQLQRLGIDPLAVTRIYSERIPCDQWRQNCRSLISVYRNAAVSYSVNSGYSADKKSIYEFMRNQISRRS